MAVSLNLAVRGCAILWKSFNIIESQLPYLQKGAGNPLRVVLRINKMSDTGESNLPCAWQIKGS